MKKRSGFTVIELIIVIAIMGILATLTIPFMDGIYSTNQRSNDVNLIRSLNNSLSIKEAETELSKVHFRDALNMMDETGYNIEDLSSSSKEKLLWNEITNRFVLESEKDSSIEDRYYWTIIDKYDENNQQYSMYASTLLEDENIDNLTVGFDVGDNLKIKNINYVRDASLESVETTIFTSEGINLTIDAPNDVIRHYGRAESITIKAVKNDSFHEYGEVEEVNLEKGRYILEKTGFAKKINVLSQNVIFAVTLKKVLPNILVYGVKSLHFQVTRFDKGSILLDTTIYVGNDHHFFLNNALGDAISGDIEEAFEDGYLVEENPSLISQDVIINELTNSEVLTLYLKEELAFNFDLNGYINDYPFEGSFIINNSNFNSISYQARFTLHLSDKNIVTEFTHILDDYYLIINDRAYYFIDGNLETLVEMFNNIVDEISLPKDFLSLTAKGLRNKLKRSTSEVNGEEIVYTCSLMDDMSPIILKSDLNYNLTSISIANLEEASYRYDINMEVNSIGTTLIDLLPSEEDYLAVTLNNMDSTTRNKIVDQLHTIVSNKEAGFNYDIKVNRDNKLTFSSQGSLDLDIEDEDVNFALRGNMVNPDSDLPLNSNFDITYLNDNIYFSYQNRLKLSYQRVGLDNLISIIKEHLEDNSQFEDFANQFMPDNSTEGAPLFEILFTSHDFMKLLNYYHNIDIVNGELVINFLPSIMNATGNDISFTISKNGKGIKEIKLDNLYAYGYTINGTLTLKEYENIAISNPESYTVMDYANNTFDKIFNLFKQKELALSLEGSVDNLSDHTTTSFTGYTQFKLTDSKNTGYGNIVIHDKQNKTHTVTLDVTKNNASSNATEQEKDQAFASSKVLFNYNNNLKGYFSLGSVMDVYNLIENLASSNDSRFEKYKDLLLADISRSTIARLLKDEVESILYNDMITNVTYSNNTYTMELNGNFLKHNDVYKCESIYVDVRLDNNHNLSGITVRSDKTLDYRFSVSLNVTNYNSSLKGLNQDSSYKDFSDLKTLTEYLLNTGKRNDYHASGTLTLDLELIKIIHPDVEDIPLDAYVHIEKDKEGEEKVYSRVDMDIPYWSSLIQNSKEWKDRKFYIYFTDTEVYLRVKTRTDSKNFEEKQVTVNKSGSKYVWTAKTFNWKEQYYTCQDVKLTMDEFFSNALYYVFNFGFDLKENLSSYSGTNDNLDYSKIINDYHFNASSPSWDVSLDMEELTTKDNYSDLVINLVGNKSTKEMQSVTASLNINVIKIINIGINLSATLDNTVISDARLTDIKNYLSYNKNHTNKTEYGSSYTYIASSSLTNDGTKETLLKTSKPIAYWGHSTVGSFMTLPTAYSYINISPSSYYVTRT